MPRANRYFLPQHVWHITHRCHKKEFLLKFAMDRESWIKWLFEARKRFGLEILPPASGKLSPYRTSAKKRIFQGLEIPSQKFQPPFLAITAKG
jgi:hypothetical protein